ncbi:DUF2162 family putative transporter [Tepidibacter aestuarii]|uniref:DUF2162 family putative transporter n=1 Tax=Tepidibacter aestuarii TaxID=2925782 RepID=UPI0020BFB7A1|nr:DUF2162 family putative transporter [Tepidibacter aestuarii]CAH2212460.1 conserved membrane protein of unknown function [Tepidibacter aestuarii]
MFLAFLGMVVSLFILSLKTGLILGASGLNRKIIVFISFIFGFVLYILIIMFTPRMKSISVFIDQYTFEGSMILAGFLIYLGLHEESQFKEDNSLCSKKHGNHIIAFLPCPFCLIAMAVSVIFFKLQVKVFNGLLELGISLFFIALLIVVAFGTQCMIKRMNIQPGGIFNSVVLFFGIITVALGLFIPNFVNSAQMSFSSMTIDSLKILTMVGVGLAVMSFIGFISYELKNRK